MKTFDSILQFQKHFDTEEKCREFLEQQRWNGTPACPYCGSLHVHRLKNNHKFQCNEKQCKGQFTATIGTIAHKTKIPLTKWFLAIYILSNHSKGISSLQLAKWLDVTQRTAWYLNHRIRAMLTNKRPELLSNVVEVDETLIGGKISNKHRKQREKLNILDNKTMVFGALDRTSGKVINQIIPDTTKESLINAVRQNVKKGSVMHSDENIGYKALKKEYEHHSVKHGKGEYVRGNVHVNSLEGYWNLLKKQINGIHHSVSPKHLQRYCNEATYRYNNRKEAQDSRFENAFANCETRLEYKQLIK